MSEPTAAPDDAPDDDAALVARCRGGDAAGWSALVRRHQRLVYAIALRIGLDEHGAADVFQTVFARLLQHLPRLNDARRLRAWLVTTTKREALQQQARSRRTVSMTGDADDETPFDVADESPIAEEALEEVQQLDRLRTAMDRLDLRCRTLLRLLFHDDDARPDYAEVARRLGVPTGSVGPTRARCLGKLRTLLA